MALTPMLTEFKNSLRNELRNDFKEFLQEIGVVPGTSKWPDKISLKETASRLGVKIDTLRKTWRKRGLIKLGRDKDGLIFCGRSLAKHINNINKK